MWMDKHKNSLEKSRSPSFCFSQLFISVLCQEGRNDLTILYSLLQKIFFFTALGTLFPHSLSTKERLAQFKHLGCSNADANSERPAVFGSCLNAAIGRHPQVQMQHGEILRSTVKLNHAIKHSCTSHMLGISQLHSLSPQAHTVRNNHSLCNQQPCDNFIFSFKTSKQVWIQKNCSSITVTLS